MKAKQPIAKTMRPSKAITTKYSMAFTLALAAVSLMSSDPVHGFTTPSVGSPTLSSHIRVSSPATLSRSPTQLHVSQIASNDNKSEGAERQNHHNQALEVTIQDLNLIEAEATGDEAADSEFLKGFGIIALITLFNASLSPVWHQVYLGNGPPPLFLNAAVSIVAFLGLITGAPLLESSGLDKNSALKQEDSSVEKWSKKSFLGGMELGLWKGLGYVSCSSSCLGIIRSVVLRRASHDCGSLLKISYTISELRAISTAWH